MTDVECVCHMTQLLRVPLPLLMNQPLKVEERGALRRESREWAEVTTHLRQPASGFSFNKIISDEHLTTFVCESKHNRLA